MVVALAAGNSKRRREKKFTDPGQLKESVPDAPRVSSIAPNEQFPLNDAFSAINERPGLEVLMSMARSVAFSPGLAEFEDPMKRGWPSLGVAVGVAVWGMRVGRGAGVWVGVILLVGVGAGVLVLIGVDVAVGLGVSVRVATRVGEAVATRVGVLVGVRTGVNVWVGVGVRKGVGLGDTVTALVGVTAGVADGDGLGVLVGAGDGVAVGGQLASAALTALAALTIADVATKPLHAG
jgi:hypothetical protein